MSNDEGKLILEDSVLGAREIAVGDWQALIKDQLRFLEAYRDDGRVPSELLLWEIKLYKFILKSPGRAKQYMDKRYEMGGALKVSKRQVADALGWSVP